MKLDGIRQKVFLDRYSLKDKAGAPIEKTPDEMWKRVAKGIAGQEKKANRQVWEKKFYNAMEGFKFLPGGRILAGAGTGFDVTYFNCFVIPSPKDSRDGILDNLKIMIEIMARGGGVGINLSSLRPKGARVKKVNGFSSGPMNWAELYSLATKDIIQQGGCFTADSRIMTHLGLIKIEDIVRSKGNFYASTHKGFKKITTKFDNGIKEVFEIETLGGYKVKTTKDHKFMTFNENGNFYLRRLSDLNIGDNLTLLPSQFIDDIPQVILKTDLPKASKFSNGRKTISTPNTLTSDLAFILGVYLSDGSRIKDEYAFAKGIRFAVDAKRKSDLALLIHKLRNVFGAEVSIRKGDGAVMDVAVFSRNLVEYFSINGFLKENSNKVFVPEQIFSSPKSVVEAFIAGVFFGDGGNRGGKGGFRITSVNRSFLEDIARLLLNLGVAAKLTKQVRPNWQDLYTLNINGARFMKRFFEIIASYNEKAFDNKISIRDDFYNFPINILKRFAYMSGIQRTIAYTNPTTSYKTLAFMESNTAGINDADLEDVEILTSTISDKIKKITRLGVQQVYDLEVEDIHLLSGNGFYTSNSRRGALMLMLHDWHPDIEEFITVKEDLRRINGANLSVCVSDDFMEAVKKDSDWNLEYPDLDDPKYDKKWTGDLKAWKKIGGKVEVKKTVKAKYLWDLICTAAWRSAEPGLHFLDRSQKRSNTAYFEQLIATNPCLTGDTLVATIDGWKRVDEITVGEEIGTVLGKGRVDQVEVHENKQVFRVKFSDGAEVRATAAHQFHAIKHAGRAKNAANKRFSQLALAELEIGDVVRVAPALMPRNSVSDLPKGWNDKEYGFFLGMLLGDGCISPKTLNRNVVKVAVNTNETEWNALVKTTLEKTGVVRLDASAGGYSANFTAQSANGAALLVRQSLLTPAYSFEKNIPLEYQNSNKDFLAGMLDGLFSTDGNIDLSSNHPFLRFKTTSKQLAQDVRRILLSFGIHGRIATLKKVAEGHIGGRIIVSKHPQYEIIISGVGMKIFAQEIGLSHPEKQKRLQTAQKEFALTGNTWLARIVSIEPDGVETVYDLHEPVSDTWITEGIVSRGCGEQPLGAWAVCNLGAINLSAYVRNAEFDYKNFAKDVKIATRFMDNVIDDTYYFYDENEKCAKDIRRIGLGILGLADALIKMKLRYGAPESEETLRKIFETLRNNAYDASAELAKEKGAFPKFNKEKYLKGYHIQNLPKEIQAKIAKHGIRNAVLLTIAPTGTTSLISGVSSGVEPVYEFEFIRRDRLGEHKMYHPLYEDWKKDHPNEDKPDYFVSANDLTPEEHVMVQAIAQEYIDSSISKTVNAPNSHSIEDVKKLYMMAYDQGLKGVTYMREGSREGVLSRVSETKEEKPVVSTEYPKTPRPMMVEGVTYKTQTPVGDTFITLNHNQNGEPFEVFITIGKPGSDVAAMADALGRMISLNLRLAGNLPPRERIRQVISQLSGIGGTRSVGFGENRVRSLPDAIAKILAKQYAFRVNGIVEDKLASTTPVDVPIPEITVLQQLPLQEGITDEKAETHLFDICPECGAGAFAYEEGCRKCYACGYSEC